jgi:acetyltransferase-like isoleucine patch superfamily enzyme
MKDKNLIKNLFNMSNNNFKSIGEDVRVHEMAIISRPELVEIGNHVAIDMWTYISTQAKLGDYIHIGPSVSIIGGAVALIVMEDFTGISSGCRIVCAGDDFTQGLLSPVVPLEYRNVINKPVTFKKYSTLGVNCVVLPGITLGEGSVVGAGSVVTKDTEPWTIYVGNPAKPVKIREKETILEYAKKLKI